MSTASVALNRKDLFLRACRGEALPRVPVWMMRQAGRYLPEYRELRAKHAFLQVCKTPDLAVEVSLQPFRRLGVDAIIVFSDILIPAEAMGLPLELGDAGPNLPEPVRSAEAVRKLRCFDPEVETAFLMEAIRRIVRTVGPEVPVLGFAAAPWTLACYMVEGRTKEGFAKVKEFLVRLSRARSEQSFSPSETAVFVFSLKRPLFTRLRQKGAELVDHLVRQADLRGVAAGFHRCAARAGWRALPGHGGCQLP